MEKIDFDAELNNINKLTLKIFDLVNLQDWDNLLSLISTNEVDYNIKNNSNIYLLEYGILFNRVDIIKALLKHDIRIDIIDDNDRSILYNVIKYSYIEILQLLIDKNNDLIGKNILEIKDNDNNIPLFYAIKFNNIPCLKIIVNNTINFYLKNSDGDNALHLSIKSNNIEIFLIIFAKITDLKSRNLNGETCLHMMIKYKTYDILNYIIDKYYKTNSESVIQTINLTEYVYNFTIMHWIMIDIDEKMLNLILNSDIIEHINGNIQDKSGNIFYHYFINYLNNKEFTKKEDSNKFTELNTKISQIEFNYNLYNIDGNTIGHIISSNITTWTTNNLKSIIINVFTKQDLNIQNYQGESVLFILVKNNYWTEIKHLLVKKKLDIFIIANNNDIIFDYIDINKLDDFISMITTSYINQLQTAPKMVKWLDYWDNRCKKNIELEELNDTELELIKSYSPTSKSMNICYDIIYNKISKFIDIFIVNKDRYNVNSYPTTIKITKLIKTYPTLTFSTYRGTTLDIMCGLIYLITKFNLEKKTYNYVESSLNLMDLDKTIINCNIIDMKTDNKICEISGFEILWKNQLLYIPGSKKNDLIRQLNYSLHSKNKFFIIPIGIEMIINGVIYSHANYLIFDFNLMEYERFEPHGSHSPFGLDYGAQLLDNQLENKINSFNLGLTYISPIQYLPKIGFQMKEISELKVDYIGDPNGFCALWCVWWVELRLSNPQIPRIKLVKLLNQELINGGYSYKKLIRDYSFYIIEIRDKILSKANTNINEWMNDTINRTNIQHLESILTDQIIAMY